MKRLVSLLLTAVLLLGLLCGCGKKEPSVIPLPSESAAEGLKTAEWTPGTIVDGIYRNDCLNLTFQIPEGWMQASEEEINTIFEIDPSDKPAIYDVFLYPEDRHAWVILGYIDLRRQIGGSSMTEDEVLDVTKADMTWVSFSETEDYTLCDHIYRGASYTDYPNLNAGRYLFSRLGTDKMAMLSIVVSTEKPIAEEQLAYYMTHFTDDPSTIPAPPVDATPAPTARFTRGEIDGSSYTNDFLGLRFDAPEGWVFGTDQDLAELMGLELPQEILGDPEAIAELFLQQVRSTTWQSLPRIPPRRSSLVCRISARSPAS